MLNCMRCRNTGRVLEQWVEWPTLRVAVTEEIVEPAVGVIRKRERECPECLGFSAIPLRPKA